MQPTRRDVFRHLTLGAMALWTPGIFAEVLTETARMGEGPFYPDKLPLDTDNDLLVITNSITPAVGEISHVSGKLLSSSGEPVRNALIEIWQVDNKGSYIHKDGENTDGRDSQFQGYGRFLTDSKGQYYFRTIKPVAYTLQGQFRAPHIHFIVGRNGKRILTTQMMIKGHEANSRDFVLAANQNRSALDTILVDFKPMAGSTIGELTAAFDIVLGKSPEIP